MIDLGLIMMLAIAQPGNAADQISRNLCEKPDATLIATFERRRANIRKYGLFFEESLWACPEEGLFESEWYGKHLAALQEPSFASPSASKGFAWRYRYFILGEFSHGTAIRIEKLKNGNARITWAEETGQGGYDPGMLKEKISKPLPPFAADELHDLAVMLDIMKSRFGASAADSSGSDTICISNFGGAIERVDWTGQHMVAEIGYDGPDGADRVSDLMNELAYHYLGKPRVRDWYAQD